MILFENFNLLIGVCVVFDLFVIVDKVVECCCGGYCFEFNKLFYIVFMMIGFCVMLLIVCVCWMWLFEIVIV